MGSWNAKRFDRTTLISKFHDPHVPSAVRSRLVQGTETPHLTEAQAVSPPFDDVRFPRNYTSWNGEGISVGAIEVDGRFVGGAATSPMQFAPAVLLWMTPAGQVAWLAVSILELIDRCGSADSGKSIMFHRAAYPLARTHTI